MPHTALMKVSWLPTEPADSYWDVFLHKLDQIAGKNHNLPVYVRENIVKEILADEDHLSRGLYLLERLFEFDQLCFDRHALNRLPIQAQRNFPTELEGLIHWITPELEVYNQTMEHIRDIFPVLPQEIQEQWETLKGFEKTRYEDWMFETIDTVPPALADTQHANRKVTA